MFKGCIYYLHEWCVERMQLFQKRRFCKRPGCGKSPAEEHICCSRTHHSQYTELYKWVGKEELIMLISKGPEWYNNELCFNSATQIVQSNPFISTSTSISDSTTMDLATELKAALIFHTDVGPVPRAYKKTEHSISQHSDRINWRADVTGCYQCGGSVTERCEYLCSEKCYLVFNEWCRLKVVDANKTEFCDYPGCGKKPQTGYSTCSKEHFEKRYSYLSSNECYRLLKQGPHWYKSTQSSSSDQIRRHKITVGIDKPIPSDTIINAPQSIALYSKRMQPPGLVSNTSDLPQRFVFSAKLTDLLIQCTDVGPIPRKLNHQNRISSGVSTIANSDIEGCYWCGSNNTSFHRLACSPRCWHLLHEWCVRKVDKCRAVLEIKSNISNI